MPHEEHGAMIRLTIKYSKMIYNNDKEGRMAVFAETVEIVERGNYEFSLSQVVELPDDASMRAVMVWDILS